MKLTLNVPSGTIHQAKHLARERKTSVSKMVSKFLEDEVDPDWLKELRQKDPGLAKLCGMAKGVKLVSKEQYLREKLGL
jgi:hypothetical protein